MIRRPGLIVVSTIFFLIGTAFVAHRLYFLRTAAKAVGVVRRIESVTDQCRSSGKHSRSYPCTRFTALVGFSTPDRRVFETRLSAGSVRGYSLDVLLATRKVGQSVKLVYDPQKPLSCYEDSLMGIFAEALTFYIGQIIFLVSSFFEPRRRRYE